MSTPEKFWRNVDTSAGPAGCWPWLGKGNVASGERYGRFFLGSAGGKKRWKQAHRAAYEFAVGPIPEGLVIDHLCRFTHCVNPAHLEPVTIRENTLRGISIPAENAVKTVCKHGHPFTQQNTYVRPDGARGCFTCRRATSAAWNARKRAQASAAA